MKKRPLSLLLLTLLFTLSLTGCGLLNKFTKEKAPEFSIDLTEGSYAEGGADGYLGDVIHTYWFNFAIDEAYTCSAYGNYTAPEGSQLLVVHMGIRNTTKSSVPMSDADFQAIWSDEADDAYAWPITTDENVMNNQVQVSQQLSEQQLPCQYDIPVKGTVMGDLVFVVPAQLPDGSPNRDFAVDFLEMFDDDSTGDYYAVYFTADDR